MPKNDEQVSLKELLSKLKEWVAYLKTKWVVLLFMALLGGVLGFVQASFTKPKFSAELTFVLTSASKMNSLASLAGQFGLDFGGGNDDAFAGDNITELLKSKRIIKGALFKKVPSASKTLLNVLVDESLYNKGIENNERTKGTLPFPDSAKNLTPIQDSLVGEIVESLAKSYISIDRVDKKLSFYYVRTNCEYPNVSYYLTKFIAEEASSFYIETKTKMARQNLNMIQHEADSINGLLNNTITTAASAADQTFNMNAAYQVQRSPIQQQQVKLNALGAAYAEIVKNLELAKINLVKETPLYQVIDSPSLPLKKMKSSRLFTAIEASLGLIIFTAMFLLFKKKY